MNKIEIINKIKEIFGMVDQKFGIYKNEEGVEFRIDDMTLDSDVYVLTPEGELPAPEGEVILEDGTKVVIKDGKISDLVISDVVEEETLEEVKVEVEEEDEEVEMAELTLIDGTIVESNGELVEGAELYVKTEEGRQPAPDGEHETEDKIIVVEGGIIKEIREKEEKVEVEVEMEEVLETFTIALETLNNQISDLRKENEELKDKFNKFSAEPAGEKIYDKKGAYIEELMNEKFSKLERLTTLRNRK
tara:strand:+ start:1652 stop:2392 length:741 start_codon:yes stop_codon:yes gene_type:complete